MTAHWLTVITVVKDAADPLARTISSVASQQLDGVDYVVVDSSTDRSAVPALLAASPLSDATYDWLPPSGIYPAMNHGLTRANGTYAYFLNAGDVFFDAQVIADVRSALALSAPIWAFGPVEIVDRAERHVITPKWDYAREQRTGFSTGHFPPHQGTFARSESLRSLGGFDPAYAIAADYAMFLKLSTIADPLHLDRVIATFTEGGVSTARWKESFAEFARARDEILDVRGTHALRMRAQAAWQYATVYAAREILHRGER